MTYARSSRRDAARAALRFALAAPTALVLTVVALAASAGEPAARGAGSAACIVLGLQYPWNWWVLVTLASTLAAVLAFAIDRALARLVGGPGRRASAWLAVAVLVIVAGALGTSSVGVFC